MSTDRNNTPIKWYRTPLSRETLAAVNMRSDWQGLVQAGGMFGLWCCTGAATLWLAFSGSILLAFVLLFMHGTVGSFCINAVHELIHTTVFKTKWLNVLFVRLFGFIGWIDWLGFKASHNLHHRHTLHPPRDGEVVLPIVSHSRMAYLKQAIWVPRAPYYRFKDSLRRAMGRIDDAWVASLFPEERPAALETLVTWNRVLLVGHSCILVGSLVAAGVTRSWAWLLVPYVLSFSSTYGSWLFYLCNSTQHIGMTDKVPDFRLCCRSMKLPRLVSFLYWHMEYHVEHHMYAAVPCYNLRKLNKLIAADLPKPKNLFSTWSEIEMILKRQQDDPSYQHGNPLPATATPVNIAEMA